MNIDIKPIDIKIDNSDLLTRIAYVLDQTKLLEPILEIRKLWNLDKKLVPYNSFTDWLTEPHYDFSPSQEIANYFTQIQDKLYSNEANKFLSENEAAELSRIILETNPLKLELEYLIFRKGINPSYKNILLKAIVCGEIRDDDKSEELRLEYQEILNDLKLGLVADSNYKRKRGKPSIVRDRGWYWMWNEEKNKGFGSYGRVLEIWNTKCPNPTYEPHEKCPHCVNDVNLIEQAVSRYRKFLRS